MIVLHQPPGAWGTPSLSPFCVKLEAFLRMAGVPYEVRPADIRKAPKGKIPYVEIDGALMGDSQLILEHLTRSRGLDLDAHLTPHERAVGHLVRRTLEEGLYFVSMWNRWVPDESFVALRPAFAAALPGPIKLLVPLIRGNVKKSLKTQGTGRHAPAEIMAMGIADLDAVSEILGDRPFLLGDRPSSFDASLFAFEEGILAFPVTSALKKHAEGLGNLVAHRARVRERWW